MDWTRRHVIGRGSSATVYLASHGNGEAFAVKSAEISQSQSLQKEQKFLSCLDSPFVVSYRGCDVSREENGVLMFNLFMEYFPDGSLSDEIRRCGGRLEEGAIRNYTRHILQGLQYIHSKDVVHCDIKARNVLIGGDGLAKLSDFGCARWANETNSIGGTPLFMAPEVARGEHQGLASDIWSIGCIIIEMATGSPWPTKIDNDPVSALYRIGYSDESPEIPSVLSRKGKNFLEKCLKRNPNERWTANELLKHPFLEELNPNSTNDQIKKVNSESPTSILEQGIWRSMEESEITESINPEWSEQIGRLAMDSGEARWIDDEDWMTIRREEIGKSEEMGELNGGAEGEVKLICSNNEWAEKQRGNGGKEWLEMEFIDVVDKKKNVNCRISRKIISFVHNNNNTNNPFSFHTLKHEFVPLMQSLL